MSQFDSLSELSLEVDKFVLSGDELKRQRYVHADE